MKIENQQRFNREILYALENVTAIAYRGQANDDINRERITALREFVAMQTEPGGDVVHEPHPLEEEISRLHRVLLAERVKQEKLVAALHDEIIRLQSLLDTERQTSDALARQLQENADVYAALVERIKRALRQ